MRHVVKVKVNHAQRCQCYSESRRSFFLLYGIGFRHETFQQSVHSNWARSSAMILIVLHMYCIVPLSQSCARMRLKLWSRVANPGNSISDTDGSFVKSNRTDSGETLSCRSMFWIRAPAAVASSAACNAFRDPLRYGLHAVVLR